MAPIAHLRIVLKAMRPRQWSKNVIVFMALVFSIDDKWQLTEPSTWLDLLGWSAVTFVLLCLISSADYLVNDVIDPTFSFMTLDHDGKIRMDCSSPYAMARLVDLRNQYDISFANDTDFDRHGIVTQSLGLLNPNHYLSVSIIPCTNHLKPTGTSASRR